MVSVHLGFLGEAVKFTLSCAIIPGRVHSLMLGSKFLRETETLTSNFSRRVRQTLRDLPRHLGLKLVGSDRHRLWGSLNGAFTAGVPDTGSDVMVVSGDYARRHKLKVERGLENRLELEFADGSTSFTNGLVRDAEWIFGESEERVICDFYVLEQLPVDVVLSNAFVFDLKVFTEYSGYIVQEESIAELAELFNIRLIGRYSPELQNVEDLFVNDITSRDSFSPLKIQAELVRRDNIRDLIAELPVHLRDAAKADEKERQRQWEDLRQRWETLQAEQSASPAAASRMHKTRRPRRRSNCRSRIGEAGGLSKRCA